MKKSTILFVLFLTPILLSAQELNSFNQERLELTQKGMLVLGSWAVGNMITNPILQSNSSGSNRYFYQMNTFWGIINLGLAGVGYYSTTVDLSVLSLSESISEQQKIEKILLFNSGLDIAYVLGGLYLTERSKNTSSQQNRLKGYGQSLILQGAWLFSFDLIFYLIQNNHSKQLLKIVDSFALSPQGVSLRLNF